MYASWIACAFSDAGSTGVRPPLSRQCGGSEGERCERGDEGGQAHELIL